MSDEHDDMIIPPTLGPGDDDGRDRGEACAITGPARPGDDDATVTDRGGPICTRGPLGPGESADDRPAVRMLAQPAAGPGETYAARRITVFPLEKE